MLPEFPHLRTAALDLARSDLARQFRSRGSGAHRVRKDVEIRKRQVFDEPERPFKLLWRIARETHKEVGADTRLGHCLDHPLHAIAEIGSIVAAPHPREGAILAGLKRQMKMRTELLALRNYFNNLIAQLFGIQRADADAIDRRPLGQHFEQICKLDAR